MTLFLDEADLIRLRAGQRLPFTAPMGELGRECVLAMHDFELDELEDGFEDGFEEHCVRIDATLLAALEDGALVSLDPGLPIDAFARRVGSVAARGTIERLLSKLFAA